jgi:5,10-methylene-tetrahydrofolate dehydrogenase/methenyl tetrahydrofolate cyclohydrolase
MFAEVRQLSESVTQKQLEAAVAALCTDPRIDGVLVQLPLPRHIDEDAIIDSFDPQKDVDGFHPLNMGGCGGAAGLGPGAKAPASVCAAPPQAVL